MSQEENNDNNKGFTVRDKRRFDEKGNPKQKNTESTEKKGTGQTASEKSAQDFVIKESHDSQSTEPQAAPPPPPPDFSAFILSLATQALVQLGEMPPPEGVTIPTNVVAAKQTIDILSMLEEKTKGNRSDAEENLIKEILHNLRMSFVRYSEKAAT